tara:strand:- start:92 stop:925 length:834 start_codon:yes stop_codon:yes gene_type:complete
MTYDDFLTDFQFEDSPETRQAFEQMFNLKSGVDHVPLKNFGFSPGPVELADRGVHGRLMSDNKVLYDTTDQEGRNFLTATDRFYNRDNWNQSDSLGTDPVSPKFLSTFPGRMSGTELASSYPPPVSVPTGSSGLLSLDAAAGTSLPYSGEGVSESLAAETAADSATGGLGGPEAYAANMALNMIPTRDRKKQSTPFGDEGSASGILKGAGKGALTGATLGSVIPGVGTTAGAIGGGILGAIGGAQGYFDSTSPPTINYSRVRQGGGMRGGLLGGLYA